MRRLAPFAWFVLAGLAPAPAGAAPLPRQFDLDCAGMANFAGDRPRDFRAVFHVDLGANRFCMDACETPHPIAGVTPDLITLSRTTGRDQFNTINSTSTYDPGTRRYRSRYVASGGIPFAWLTEAQCEVRRFTPFPANAAMSEGE